MSEFILGDCLEYMRKMPDNAYDLAIVDPPYGINIHKMNMGKGVGVAQSRNYQLTDGHDFDDAKPPSEEYFKELFRVSRKQIIWGGQYFDLPKAKCWIVWDKLKPEGVSFGDCELAWTSFNCVNKMFRFQWHGMLQGDMRNKEERIHPTQKPVALYEWLLAHFAKKGYKILDTHVGSGSSLVACYNMGYEYTGFEIDEAYYKRASERIAENMAQIRMVF